MRDRGKSSYPWYLRNRTYAAGIVGTMLFVILGGLVNLLFFYPAAVVLALVVGVAVWASGKG